MIMEGKKRNKGLNQKKPSVFLRKNLIRGFILVLFHCTGNLRLEKKKNNKILKRMAMEAESSLCEWGREGGVNMCGNDVWCSAEVPQKVQTCRMAVATLSDRRSPQLWSDATLRRPRRACFQPTCVSEKEPLILLYCCKIHPEEVAVWRAGRSACF